jgi:hypothetical protein
VIIAILYQVRVVFITTIMAVISPRFWSRSSATSPGCAFTDPGRSLTA